MRNWKSILTVLLSTAIFTSCDTDTELPQLKAVGDIFVRCVKDGDDIKYAPVVYAYSNYNMVTVDVSGPEGSDIMYELDEYFFGKTDFRKAPLNIDYTTEDITNGVYTFDVVTEAQGTIQVKDKLLEDRISPVEIEKFTYDTELHSFDIEWKEIEGADAYVVKVQEEIDGEYLYISGLMSENNHQFSEITQGWSYFEKEAGSTYVVGVYAYKFESSTVKSNIDINCESVEFKEIIW